MIQIHVDHLAEVCIHQFHDYVQVKKLLQRFLGSECIQKANDLENIVD